MPKGGADAAIVWLLAVVPLAILWGYLSARFVERPVRAWASRWGRRAPRETARS
jgi:peptidoglycan/LPS O-acetylase OafA/YrhL